MPSDVLKNYSYLQARLSPAHKPNRKPLTFPAHSDHWRRSVPVGADRSPHRLLLRRGRMVSSPHPAAALYLCNTLCRFRDNGIKKNHAGEESVKPCWAILMVTVMAGSCSDCAAFSRQLFSTLDSYKLVQAASRSSSPCLC